MAPPGIIGRSKGLYPQKPRWQGGLWNGMFPGASAAPTSLGGQAPMQSLGREGISPLFDAPPQSPYRPGKAPGINPMGFGQMAKFDALQGMLGQFQEGREDLRGGRMRQEELRQGQFNTNWQQYAQQAPLMNMYQSPQFGQTAQGMGLGGVSPLSAEEGQYWRGRNAYPNQPGTEQMYDRFGPGSPLTAAGRSGSLTADPRALSREEWGRGVALNERAMQQAEMQQRAGLLDSEGMLNRTYQGPYTRRDRDGDIAYTSREQALRDAGQDTTADQVAAARQAKFDAFRERRKALGLRTRDDIAGRRADRDAERSETMQNRQAQMLSRRGISPLSPEGQSLAPDLYTSIQNRRRGVAGGAAGGSGSPLTTPDGTPVTPVAKGAPQNPTTREQARTASHAMLAQRPVFRSIGLDAGAGPDEMPSPSEVVQGLNSAVLQSGAGLTDDDLKDLHEYAVQVAAAASPNEKPFSAGGLWSPPDAPEDQWNELATLPSNDAKGRRDWWDRYKAKHLSTRPKPPGGDVGNSSWSSPLQGQIF